MTKEAVRLLSEYIKINTTNPPGDEDKAVKFFKKIFDGEGIESRVYESEPGRQSIRALIKGTGEKPPLILMHHMDVVPADRGEWSFDPFGGEIIDGYICGRGTLDCKGLGIMELMAFLKMKREGKELNRDLIFLGCADEEMAGEKGAGYLVENHFDDFKAGVVINEGGAGILDLMPGKPLFLIATSEKGLCRLKLTRKGPPGHAATPHDNNALVKLTQALARLTAEETPLEVKPIIARYFENLAQGWPFLSEYLEDKNPDTLIKGLESSGLLKNPQIAAVLRNTISLTIMKAGNKVNIIPGKAEAQLDCRLLPGQDVEEFIAYIKEKLKDDEIDIEVMEENPATESPSDTEGYGVIEDVIREKFPDSIISPHMLTGASDSRFFREVGIPAYGVIAGIFSLVDLTSMIHGIDEKISEENLIMGTEVIAEIVERLCA